MDSGRSSLSQRYAVHYDSSDGMLCTAVRFAHTVVPDVLRRWDFWFILALHIALSIAFRTGILRDVEPDFGEHHSVSSISWHDIRVVTAMTTFFEVFYTNQCYARYLLLYTSSRRCLGLVYELILDLRLYLGKHAYLHLRLCSRFALAAIFLGFYEHVGGEVSDREWETMVAQRLLTEKEKEFLCKYQNQQHSQLLLYWAADVAREGLDLVRAPNNATPLIMGPITHLRHAQQELVDVMGNPIPFQYYHLLNAMVCMNLILWGYAMAIVQSVFATLIYIMASIIFMGMMELANQLSDPFGEDEVDFPLDNWRDGLLECVEVLLTKTYPGCEKTWADALTVEESREGKHFLLSEEAKEFQETPRSVSPPSRVQVHPEGYKALALHTSAKNCTI